MRVLFLTTEVPHPPHSGGTIKTASVLDYLRRRHEVHLLCFRRRPLTEEQARWCAAVGQVELLLLDRGRTPLSLLSSYLRGLPLSVERNRSAAMTALAFRRLGEGGYEAAILPRFDAVFAVSEADRQALIELGARPERLRLLPNLPVPALLERPTLTYAATEPLILYFGTLSWQPNLQGIAYLLRTVFPLVRQRLPEVRLVIAGREAPPWLRRLARRTAGVEFLGPVEDAEPMYLRARLFIEASGSGGGTRLKVLNALARGLPVVASPEGAEGLNLVTGEHLLVADDPQSMAEAVVRLMVDPELWRSLSENGRALVRRRYPAETAYRPLDEVLSGAGAKV